MHTSVKNPYGFSPRNEDYYCRGSGTSQSIAPGDLVVFDFVNATSNDPAAVVSSGAPARNGFCAVMKYVEATHRAGPNEYGVALEPITTDSSGNPILNGKVRRFGRVQINCDATGITKGLGVMPSDATDGAAELKPVADSSSAATLKASFRATIGQALESKANGLGWINFDGHCMGCTKVA